MENKDKIKFWVGVAIAAAIIIHGYQYAKGNRYKVINQGSGFYTIYDTWNDAAHSVWSYGLDGYDIDFENKTKKRMNLRDLDAELENLKKEAERRKSKDRKEDNEEDYELGSDSAELDDNEYSTDYDYDEDDGSYSYENHRMRF